jgi:hypothetical protein
VAGIFKQKRLKTPVVAGVCQRSWFAEVIV